MSNTTLVKNITGVILSGGFSKRIGKNKSILEVDGITLIERNFLLLKQIFENVIISTNEPELYNFLDAEKVIDIYKGFGPLGGIHASLKHVSTDKIFVIAVDMPFLLKDLIKFILEVKSDEAIILPIAENQIHYLCGIYGKEIIPVAENILEANQIAVNQNKNLIKSSVSLWNFVERFGAEIVNVEEKLFYMKDLFFNVNTLEDFELAKEKLF